MKTPYPLKTAFFLLAVLPRTFSLQAQSSLEFGSASGPITSGSTIASQVITFKGNVNNVIDNIFTAYTPAVTVTFALSNQQYVLPAAQIPTTTPLSFGSTVNGLSKLAASAPQFTAMNYISAAPASSFSSVAATVGTGISTASNYGVEIFNSAMGMYNASSSTSGSYHMGDLTITFNKPVTNPVIHVVGLGGAANFGGPGTLGFSSSLQMTTSGVTLSKLSGSTELSVTSTQINNSAVHPTAATGSGAASGSILATGTSITSLTFKIFLTGDGVLSNWATAATHVGDAFMIGVSSLASNVILPVTLSEFQAVVRQASADLRWTTAMEENSRYYDIERSTDKGDWKNIGYVKAAGISSMPTSYYFVDDNPAAGDNYYRLKEVDLDGNAVYSGVRQVSFEQASKLSFFPNPVRDRVTITNSGAPFQSVAVLAFDGRQLQQIQDFASGGTIDMSRYPSGIYFLAVRKATGTSEVLKVLKD